jgi:hypothetical protein
MQVKCYFQPDASTIFPDLASDNIRLRGTAVLNQWISRDHAAGPNTIMITSANYLYMGQPSEKMSDALFILGGRQSIVEWLRVQGTHPTIRNHTQGDPLYASVMRKKQKFDKNLTMVALLGRNDLRVHGADWSVKAPVNLRAGQGPSVFEPMQLAAIMQNVFAGDPV